MPTSNSALWDPVTSVKPLAPPSWGPCFLGVDQERYNAAAASRRETPWVFWPRTGGSRDGNAENAFAFRNECSPSVSPFSSSVFHFAGCLRLGEKAPPVGTGSMDGTLWLQCTREPGGTYIYCWLCPVGSIPWCWGWSLKAFWGATKGSSTTAEHTEVCGVETGAELNQRRKGSRGRRKMFLPSSTSMDAMESSGGLVGDSYPGSHSGSIMLF